MDFKSLLFVSLICCKSLSMSGSGVTLTQQEKKLFASSQNVEKKVRDLFERELPYYAQPIKFNDAIHLWISGSQVPFTNVVNYSAYTDENSVKNAITWVVEKAKDLQVSVTWWITPQTKPDNMADLLKEKGFVLSEVFSAMLCFLDEIHASNNQLDINFVIKKVTDQNQVDLWMQTLGAAFELDQAFTLRYGNVVKQNDLNNRYIEHYALYHENEIVSTGSLCINGDYAEIANISTNLLFRRKGMATRLTTFLLHRAQELGLKYAVLVSDSKAESIYRKVGFKKIFDIDYWVRK